MLSVNAIAQKKIPVSGAENGLVGIKLYDSGQRVIAMYGSPIEVQPVSFGSTAIGPGGGAGAPAGGRGGGRPGLGGGPASQGASTDTIGNSPIGSLDFGDEFLRQKGGPGGEDRPTGTAGAGGAGGGGAAPGGGGGGVAAEGVVYTRWIYKRGMSKYGFILDKQNRVVQIEAIGMQDSRVKTRRGTMFGASFGSLIKKYGTPDGYEINGDSILVRFLQRSKVAFRLNRLGKDKPHQVTGIVVAGGKA
jgi:hypothetical protein